MTDGGPEIKLVEMQDWSQGYAQDAPPVWRVELGGYCADFEHEQAARNWADAIVRYASRPEPAADAVEAVWDALKAICASDPTQAVRLVLVTRDDVADALAALPRPAANEGAVERAGEREG